MPVAEGLGVSLFLGASGFLRTPVTNKVGLVAVNTPSEVWK
jgi:hypothetical protein